MVVPRTALEFHDALHGISFFGDAQNNIINYCMYTIIFHENIDKTMGACTVISSDVCIVLLSNSLVSLIAAQQIHLTCSLHPCSPLLYGNLELYSPIPIHCRSYNIQILKGD